MSLDKEEFLKMLKESFEDGSVTIHSSIEQDRKTRYISHDLYLSVEINGETVYETKGSVDIDLDKN